MYYGYDLGCRFSGIPHDLVVINENRNSIYEKCKICGKRLRWNKSNKGRINNKEYLKAHIRDFAQPNGDSKRIYNKIYNNERTIIQL